MVHDPVLGVDHQRVREAVVVRVNGHFRVRVRVRGTGQGQTDLGQRNESKG